MPFDNPFTSPSPAACLAPNQLQAMMQDFVDRMQRDVLIGFFFRNVNIQRLAQREYAHAAQVLGLPGPAYDGRDLTQVHRRLHLTQGQFLRRKRLLLQTMHDHQLEVGLQTTLLAHQDRLFATFSRPAAP